MTVKELIAKLAEMPADASITVRVDCPNGGNSLPADVHAEEFTMNLKTLMMARTVLHSVYDNNCPIPVYSGWRKGKSPYVHRVDCKARKVAQMAHHLIRLRHELGFEADNIGHVYIRQSEPIGDNGKFFRYTLDVAGTTVIYVWWGRDTKRIANAKVYFDGGDSTACAHYDFMQPSVPYLQ